MKKSDIMEYLDKLVEERNKPVGFMEFCPCCGAPLIIEKNGINYTIEEFKEIDFGEDNC